MMTPLLVTSLIVFASQQPLPGITHDQPLRDRIALTLTSERPTYYVGETARLQVALHNFSDETVLGAFTLSPRIGKTRVLYRRGTSPFKELEHLDGGGDYMHDIVRLDPDEHLTHDFVVAYDPTPEMLVFDTPGDYQFMVRYRDVDSPNAVLVSDPLSVSVLDVPPNHREALDVYRRGLALLAEPGRARRAATDEQVAAAADFLEKYPASPYWRDVRGGLYSVLWQRVQRRSATDSERALLERIESEWGGDTTPPALGVSAAPDHLWPPNNKLVPISVTVSVADDTDPHPDVKLVSITCDDDCDVAGDVAGAEFGNDDRTFELRAKRRGGGSGRTYTITYSATDAFGNATRATTTVTVPHDQRAPAWSGNGVSYTVGDQVSYETHRWRCIQAHRSQSDWSPPRTPALWVKVPVGRDWDYPVEYAVGAEVTHGGASYRCLQAHTSQAGWTPPATPALWTRISN